MPLMTNLLLIVLLSPPFDGNTAAALEAGDAGEVSGLCLKTQSLSKGAVSPCTGILWTISHTRKALTCKKADLPKCKNDLVLCRDLYRSQEIAYTTLLGNCNTLVVKYRGMLDDITPIAKENPWYRTTTFIAVVSLATFAGGVWLGVGF